MRPSPLIALCVLPAAVLSLAALCFAGRGGPGGPDIFFPAPPKPPTLDFTLAGNLQGDRFVAGSGGIVYISAVQVNVGLRVQGNNTVPNTVTVKSFFQPGDISINIDFFATNPPDSGDYNPYHSRVKAYDPIAVAFKEYQKDHPKAVLLPPPAEAPTRLFPKNGPLPIKCRVAPSGAPDAQPVELDCSSITLPEVYSVPGPYFVEISIAPAAATFLDLGADPDHNQFSRGGINTTMDQWTARAYADKRVAGTRYFTVVAPAVASHP